MQRSRRELWWPGGAVGSLCGRNVTVSASKVSSYSRPVEYVIEQLESRHLLGHGPPISAGGASAVSFGTMSAREADGRYVTLNTPNDRIMLNLAN